ncbi:Oidioi.mRNA.OKI2018_I69.XSR.g13370.t1.cds [Oikopleura dioica]|uniref:Oidioi.mRNA.OKI2018_I69.XSR.g13370.t1.cds n=1 Tax=Oikopleura dioica TaxID=34765 RepID=A0ABN7SBC3_OIKDI|nr:Oidioi.mRNA.OKI2018_I69.XSR.g13370.t1.cds [Oikopleura dioica]
MVISNGRSFTWTSPFDASPKSIRERVFNDNVKKMEAIVTKEVKRISKGRYLIQVLPEDLQPWGRPKLIHDVNIKMVSLLHGDWTFLSPNSYAIEMIHNPKMPKSRSYGLIDLAKTKLDDIENLLSDRSSGGKAYICVGPCVDKANLVDVHDRILFFPISSDVEPSIEFEPYEPSPIYPDLILASFVYEVSIVDREEYQIPDWVEEEDEKSKGKKDAGKQKPKKEKKKQPAKQINKQKNDDSKEENLKPQEEKPSSGERPTPQLELDNFDEAEWVTVGSSKPRKNDLQKLLKEPTAVAKKIVKPENQVLKDENAALKERLRRLETEMKCLKSEKTAWDAEVGHFFAANRQETDSDDETIDSTMTKWAESSLAISESVSKIGRRKVIPKVYPSEPRHKPKEYLEGGSGRYNPITGKVEYPKPPTAPQPEF